MTSHYFLFSPRCLRRARNHIPSIGQGIFFWKGDRARPGSASGVEAQLTSPCQAYFGDCENNTTFESWYRSNMKEPVGVRKRQLGFLCCAFVLNITTVRIMDIFTPKFHFWILFFKKNFCVCVVCACMCMAVHTHVCACVWRQEVNVGSIALHLSFCLFLTGWSQCL